MRFVLIHGGFHGAWCWERVIGELGRLGHEAIAIDLPGHGQRRDERSTLAGRRDAITAVLQPGDVLVGHSGGGYDITLAADAAPDKIRHLVYLAAGLPIEGKTVLDATGGAPSQAGDAQAGVSPITIEGSHSPFLSRPAQLARLLAHAAATTPVGPLLPS